MDILTQVSTGKLQWHKRGKSKHARKRSVSEYDDWVEHAKKLMG